MGISYGLVRNAHIIRPLRLQSERDSLQNGIIMRTKEVEHLTAENTRLSNDWNLRESSLISSHEVRIKHLMNTLKEREQHICDQHNELHRAKVQVEAYKSETSTLKHNLEVLLHLLSVNALPRTEPYRAMLPCMTLCVTIFGAQAAQDRACVSERKRDVLSQQLRETEARLAQKECEYRELQCAQSATASQNQRALEMAQQNCSVQQNRIESLAMQLEEKTASLSALRNAYEKAVKEHSEKVCRHCAGFLRVSVCRTRNPCPLKIEGSK
jgi:hypothetical protein